MLGTWKGCGVLRDAGSFILVEEGEGFGVMCGEARGVCTLDLDSDVNQLRDNLGRLSDGLPPCLLCVGWRQDLAANLETI